MTGSETLARIWRGAGIHAWRTRTSTRLRPETTERVRHPATSAQLPSGLLIVIVGSGSAIVVWLTGLAGSSSTLQLEAVRTGATIAFGVGGLGTLLLFARRQWLQEATQEHAESTAEDARHDAEERRITDLYIQAVEQLGNDSPTVQLAGLYGLDRLARNYPSHQQVVMNVITAYLRIPPTAALADATETVFVYNRHDEEVRIPVGQREVRLTAQRILADSLRAGYAIDGATSKVKRINLNGAMLFELDLSTCVIPAVEFRGAEFLGASSFSTAHFTGAADFTGSRCHEPMAFTDTRFTGSLTFEYANIRDAIDFSDSIAESQVAFCHTRFGGEVGFSRSKLEGASFKHAIFHKGLLLERAVICGHLDMESTQVLGTILLQDAKIWDRFDIRFSCVHGQVVAGDATFNGYVGAKGTKFRELVILDHATFNNRVKFSGAKFRDGIWREGTTCSGHVGKSAQGSGMGM